MFNIVEDSSKSYDMELLKESVGDSPETLSEIIRCFLKDIPVILYQLEQGIQQNNKPQIAHAAHSLKGNLKLLGMNQTYEQLREMEQIGKGSLSNVNDNRLQKQWNAVKQTFEVVLDEMSRDLKEMASVR